MNAESDFGPRQARRRIRVLIAVLAGATLMALAIGGMPTARAKHGTSGGGTALAALNTLAVPAQPDIQRFIKDSTAAKKLGKALFWDMQAGSDGRTACATCHYDAGTDNRSRNQINPRGGSFNFRGKAANAQLTAGDFPLHQLADPNDANSAVTFDTDNVVGSQGVMPSTFTGVNEGDPFDAQSFAGVDADFHVGSVNVRRTTGRNAPSVINAVFNNRSFWDGRAQNEFNGVDPFGNRDVDARVGQVNASGGVDKVAVSIANSSLASQADGPPGNPVEMSSDGRTLSDIGKKLLSVRPLGTQQVSRTDSMLGSDITASGRGLNASYADMIKAAFQSEWWNASSSVTAPNGNSYSLMQFNFPLFWGLAIQAYESTLVSDQAPVDKFLAGDTSALSAQAQQGMGVFSGNGGCESCGAYAYARQHWIQTNRPPVLGGAARAQIDQLRNDIAAASASILPSDVATDPCVPLPNQPPPTCPMRNQLLDDNLNALAGQLIQVVTGALEQSGASTSVLLDRTEEAPGS